VQNSSARAWEETVVIPTYGVGQPDKNPMFLEKRVYQGSSGVVYPYPIIDKVEDTPQPKEYKAVFLENRYLRIMLLPELGGRVQMALDKTNDYHFVYYNRVIKPALVGLAGPWISGGIEFNFPQHHRPTTYMPVEYHIEERKDGSVVCWCSEIERMFRLKSMIGFTLYPDAAFLELNVQVYNRTDKPQTFLWWANPAVHVNDDYQSIFPPDVHAVMDHGKRAVSDFSIATGTYYKVDYSPGTDISRYKNIPVPTSYMAYHSDFDFVGCYDHGKRAGMMHVANHHVVPGKKQWTWGNGEFGKAWDRQLTDEDGPYIELMCGAFTDNQPDFSWLMPGEEKRFTQVFMPYKEIGGAKNATRECIVNLDVADGVARFGVYVSRPRTVNVDLLHQEGKQGTPSLYRREIALSPEVALVDEIAYDGEAGALILLVTDEKGVEMIRYTPLTGEPPPIPEPAKPAPPPSEVPSNDELYLHGLHLEQYRHATYAPEPYYEEALRRDPGDARCNNALGLLLLRRGKFADAEPYFRRAIARLTMRNPNPYDGEPHYNLGLSLKMQGRYDEAYDAFYKATWNIAWRAAASFELARIDCRRGRYTDALALLDTTLRLNADHHQARHLRIVCLRELGEDKLLDVETKASLEIDPYNPGALDQSSWDYDKALGKLYPEHKHNLPIMQHFYLERNHVEIALDLIQAGQPRNALMSLSESPIGSDPMAKYYAAWCLHNYRDQLAHHLVELLEDLLQKAASANPTTLFPNEVEAVPALQLAIEKNPADANAPYALGNFWYAHRQYDDAIAMWELAAERNPAFATPFRNLGIAYMNKRGDGAKARGMYAQAFVNDPFDARVLFELDQLEKKLGAGAAERLVRLDEYPALVAQRDDMTLERITLLNLLGRHQDALDALLARTFHPWEGGEGKVAEQYVISLLQLARGALRDDKANDAVALLVRAREYSHNLNEGKLAGTQENHIHYTLGLAYDALGEAAEARAHYEAASVGISEPSSAMYYNDQPPDMIFYQGMARHKLGQADAARAIFEKLVAYGQAHVDDDVKMDYFAVSLPNFLIFDDDLTLRNRIHCLYIMALGYQGMGQRDEAEAQFAQVLALEPCHIGAAAHRL
jgi:tetratricopeptide (TPR) repeat protein